MGWRGDGERVAGGGAAEHRSLVVVSSAPLRVRCFGGAVLRIGSRNGVGKGTC